MDNFKKWVDEKRLNEASGLPFGIGKNIEDEVGDVWVVTKGTPNSEIIDILFEASIPSMMLQTKGGLEVDDIIYIGPQTRKQKAANIAQDVLGKIADGDESYIRQIGDAKAPKS